MELNPLFEAIDEANAEDPRKLEHEGQQWPYELLYGSRMSARLDSFAPQASICLKIAARAQHIRRWEIPRSSFPLGKRGYYKWREELKKFHAKLVSQLMEEQGFSTTEQARVSLLLSKKQLKTDEESQMLEDVIYLVFLEYYLGEFAEKGYSEEKLIDILRKTWKKMSDKARDKAIQLDLSDELKAVVHKALSKNTA
ncbi:MAG: DUF4202 domain-containing protein [Bacteroidota bacterium]